MGVRNASGELGSMADRPENLAVYFRDVQWQLERPHLLPSHVDRIHSEIPVPTDSLCYPMLSKTLRRLKVGKASGHDDIPPDFGKPYYMTRGPWMSCCFSKMNVGEQSPSQKAGKSQRWCCSSKRAMLHCRAATSHFLASGWIQDYRPIDPPAHA